MSGNSMLVCEDNVASRYYDEHERVCRLPNDGPREAVELSQTAVRGARSRQVAQTNETAIVAPAALSPSMPLMCQ